MLYIFCSVNKLAGLSFNGGLMFVGLVPIPYDWHDFIKHLIDADEGWIFRRREIHACIIEKLLFRKVMCTNLT